MLVFRYFLFYKYYLFTNDESSKSVKHASLKFKEECFTDGLEKIKH